ncbi:MAG: hypothetical protein HOP12_03980 [Candidatus Eisenbacteria bacterium]|uniref:Response regulatory domain-containing protein n=1 Tax=Eiseniibacteriota bacterium TaxID=2212470 RepID=A0A849SFR6_UNCEI|nr:hypothetical protein [Candidatus Eisenbacteria bacterium]
MSERCRVLLIPDVDEDGSLLRGALEREENLELSIATAWTDPHGGEVRSRADVVIVARSLPPETVTAWHAARTSGSFTPQLLVGANLGDATQGTALLRAGADDLVALPLDPIDVLARLRAAVARHQLARALERSHRATEALQERERDRLDRVVDLLVAWIEHVRPGATNRGRRAAELSARLAERFGIPFGLRRDMHLAARLAELGPAAIDAADRRDEDPGHMSLVAQNVLSHLSEFADAAQLLSETQENWDGTGGPQHLLQGQIPLRSRIVRATHDLLAMLETTNDPTGTDALERLASHAGTFYDPMVVVHLRALMGMPDAGTFVADRVTLPVAQLKEGMVLAEDLCSDGGVKLLASGTRFTGDILETIRRRHRSEPLSGAMVRRDSL